MYFQQGLRTLNTGMGDFFPFIKKKKITTLNKELYRLCVYRQRSAIYNPKINNLILSDFASGCSSVH